MVVVACVWGRRREDKQWTKISSCGCPASSPNCLKCSSLRNNIHILDQKQTKYLPKLLYLLLSELALNDSFCWCKNLMRKVDSLERTLMLGGIVGRRRRGRQRVRWLDGITNSMDMSLGELLEFAQTHVHRVSDAIQPAHPLGSSSPPAFNLS